jgi:hypothetical protein
MLTEKNHVIEYSTLFLNYLKSLTYELNGDDTPDKLAFDVLSSNITGQTVICDIDGTIAWIRNDELVRWIKLFSNIKVHKIESMVFGYVHGVVHAMSMSSIGGSKFYHIWAELTYK